MRKPKFGEMNEPNVMAGLGTGDNLVAEAEDNEDGIDADVDPTSPDDTTGSPANFIRFANGLIDAANEDDEMAASHFAPRRGLICYFGRQELSPPAKLFHFQKLGSSDNETPSGWKWKDLDYDWEGAVKNLDKV